MPGGLLHTTAAITPKSKNSKSGVRKPDTSLYLIVRSFQSIGSTMLMSSKSADDTVYEQDILRDPTSIKPWLGYIDYKYQHGTLLEQAYVSGQSMLGDSKLIYAPGDGTCMYAPSSIVQIVEDGSSIYQSLVWSKAYEGIVSRTSYQASTKYEPCSSFGRIC